MNAAFILIIAILGIYLAWKLMGPVSRRNTRQQRFSIRQHRKNRRQVDEEEEEEDNN